MSHILRVEIPLTRINILHNLEMEEMKAYMHFYIADKIKLLVSAQ